MENTILVNNKKYHVIELLGHGKGGYSYLVERNNIKYVLKQIHHEPCSYYTFGDKLQSELNDYQRLLKLNILIPKLYEVDYTCERIIKEFIDGPTMYELVKNDLVIDKHLQEIENIAKICYKHNLNIDYYPTNFIVKDDNLYYIDYECNEYDPKWNFENWGIRYWSKTKEFLSTLE